MIRPLRLLCLLCACELFIVAPRPVHAREFSAGVSVGGIQVGTESRLAVSPFANVFWRKKSEFRLEVHNMFSIVPGSRVGLYDRTAVTLGYDTKTGKRQPRAIPVDLLDAGVRSRVL